MKKYMYEKQHLREKEFTLCVRKLLCLEVPS